MLFSSQDTITMSIYHENNTQYHHYVHLSRKQETTKHFAEKRTVTYCNNFSMSDTACSLLNLKHTPAQCWNWITYISTACSKARIIRHYFFIRFRIYSIACFYTLVYSLNAYFCCLSQKINGTKTKMKLKLTRLQIIIHAYHAQISDTQTITNR